MSDKSNGKKKATRAGNQLGTFGGVFTPSVLTILGVIMFMRAGFVVGQAGILYAVVILVISQSITTLTAFSISAVSTNTQVAGGGAYFLISRALGPEFGGAIGLALFCAQAISVPFYILGFTEAFFRSFPSMAQHSLAISLTTTIVLFFISYIGAQWAIKTQYIIMAILVCSILAFFGGAAIHFHKAVFVRNWKPAYTGTGMSFWSVFAIYFPAVTGIMAGVNMSGDLKDPARSIPLGTFAAVGVGFLVYIAQIFVVGGAQSRIQLLNSSFETLCNQAAFGTGFFVVAGVFSATLSSAIGSFLGAPRVLQAVARDQVIPLLSPFAHGTAKGNEPRRAMWLTLGISVIIIIWASLNPSGGAFNAVAAVVTMFFLYTYGMVNLAAFVESFAENPSFRPSFRYNHWTLAMAGALGCGLTAFLIDPLPAAIAALFLMLFYYVLRRRILRVRFGDARWGFAYSRLRSNILKLCRMPLHPKNWRPMIMVLTGNPETHMTMVMYALWIGESRGLVTLARVLVGDIEQVVKLRETALLQLNHFLSENDFKALSCVVVTQSLDEGLATLIQGHPVSPLTPNIVMMGWSSDPERAEHFVRHLNTARLLGMSLIMVRDKGLPLNNRKQRIDIWWRGRENGSLMVLLAHLLAQNWPWAEADIRMLRLIEDEAGREPSTRALEDLLAMARVNARVQVLVSSRTFVDVLHQHSADASMVFLGFNIPDKESALNFQAKFETMMSELPTTLMIASSGAADLFV